VEQAASEGIADPRAPGGRGARTSADRTELPKQPDDEAALSKSALPRDPSSLWIEVRDQRDQLVADVPVGLRTADTEHSQWRWRGVTGRDGRVRAPNVTTVEGSRDKIAFAEILLPLANGERLTLRREQPPRAPLVLHLPPTGSVEVAIDGDYALAEGAEVRLRSFADLAKGANTAPMAVANTAKGRATFALIGLGLQLEAEATRKGQNEPSRVVFDGPRSAGQLVFARLSLLPKGATMIVARIEDESGQLCRDAKIDYTIDSRSVQNTTSSNSAVTTGDDGVLRLVLDDHLGPDAERTLSLAMSTASGEVQSCRIALPRPLPEGVHDLGAQRLGRPPLVCAGTILDAQGKPVVGAKVFVQSPKPVRDPTQSEWRDEHNLEGASTALGLFAIRGSAPTAELRIRVDAAGFLPALSVPFPPATDHLRITLQRAATLTGSVVLAEPLTAADVVIEVRQGERMETGRLTPRGEVGEFAFASLSPGTAAVRVRTVGNPHGEHLVSDVTLQAGENTADPRLQNIDLLQGMRALSFTVTNGSGAPLSDTMVFVLDGDPAQKHFEGLLLAHGTGRLLTHAPTTEALLWAPGHLWTKSSLADGAVIALPQAIPVTLMLDPASQPRLGETLTAMLWPLDPLLGDIGDYVLYASLHATRSGTGALPWRTHMLGRVEAGRVTVPLARPGRYAVRWQLTDARGERPVGPDREITVPEGAGAQFAAGLRSADLDAARRR
jgi:hypothetical protein